jgi:hypothetical protein
MGEDNLTDLIPENGISFNFSNIEKIIPYYNEFNILFISR